MPMGLATIFTSNSFAGILVNIVLTRPVLVVHGAVFDWVAGSFVNFVAKRKEQETRSGE